MSYYDKYLKYVNKNRLLCEKEWKTIESLDTVFTNFIQMYCDDEYSYLIASSYSDILNNLEKIWHVNIKLLMIYVPKFSITKSFILSLLFLTDKNVTINQLSITNNIKKLIIFLGNNKIILKT